MAEPGQRVGAGGGMKRGQRGVGIEHVVGGNRRAAHVCRTEAQLAEEAQPVARRAARTRAAGRIVEAARIAMRRQRGRERQRRVTFAFRFCGHVLDSSTKRPRHPEWTPRPVTVAARDQAGWASARVG